MLYRGLPAQYVRKSPIAFVASPKRACSLSIRTLWLLGISRESSRRTGKRERVREKKKPSQSCCDQICLLLFLPMIMKKISDWPPDNAHQARLSLVKSRPSIRDREILAHGRVLYVKGSVRKGTARSWRLFFYTA
jgi:hypothetical protein